MHLSRIARQPRAKPNGMAVDQLVLGTQLNQLIDQESGCATVGCWLKFDCFRMSRGEDVALADTAKVHPVDQLLCKKAPLKDLTRMVTVAVLWIVDNAHVQMVVLQGALHVMLAYFIRTAAQPLHFDTRLS